MERLFILYYLDYIKTLYPNTVFGLMKHIKSAFTRKRLQPSYVYSKLPTNPGNSRGVQTLLLMLLVTAALSSCQKDVTDVPVPVKQAEIKVVLSATPDTIPDGGAFKIKMQKDSSAIDETAVIFNKTASPAFSNTSDAVYFPGFGIGSLASVTSDGISCAIQKTPFTPGKTVRLNVNAKSNGIYILKLSYLNKIPQNVNVWLMDSYMKDSLDMRVGNYAFQVIKSDTTTFGKGRFKIILR